MKKYLILLMVMFILAVPAASVAAPLSQGQDYVVQADDWLSKLADKFLGDVLAYPAITYYTNQKNSEDESYAKITSSDVIEVGWKIYIPTQEEAEAYFGGSTQSVGAGTIKIGALAPLSAPGSVSGGTAMKAAMEIALAEINAAGGVLGQQVELVFVDTEGLAERGTSAMRRLINQEGVVGVVGEYHSAVGLTAKEVAHEYGVPTVFAETWNDTITSVQYPEVFRIAPLSSEVAAVDANFLQSIDAKYVVIMTENTGYGIPAAEQTAEQLASRGIESDTFFADIGTLDFAAVIERIKAGRAPDAIWVLLTGETSFNFQQQAAEAGIGPQNLVMICNQAAADSDAYWAAVPDGNLCLWRRIGLPQQLWTDETTAFAAKYKEATGKEAPESFAMEAYDSLKIMAQAINEAGSADPQAIINALENITYKGALGTITFPVNAANPPDAAGKDPKWWHQFPDPAITMVQFTEKDQKASDVQVVFPDAYKTGDLIRP
ncbi:MAG: ABC transporter substrate-binding protein [Anaerolineae bacterium]|nr:ABC transporter substrate-binding protein [Anaerolineae bacterium]